MTDVVRLTPPRGTPIDVTSLPRCEADCRSAITWRRRSIARGATNVEMRCQLPAHYRIDGRALCERHAGEAVLAASGGIPKEIPARIAELANAATLAGYYATHDALNDALRRAEDERRSIAADAAVEGR